MRAMTKQSKPTREQRLAAKLRENLHRRKAQARALELEGEGEGEGEGDDDCGGEAEGKRSLPKPPPKS